MDKVIKEKKMKLKIRSYFFDWKNLNLKQKLKLNLKQKFFISKINLNSGRHGAPKEDLCSENFGQFYQNSD